MLDDVMHAARIRQMIEKRKQSVVRALSQHPEGATVTELKSKIAGITKRDPAIVELLREGRIKVRGEKRNRRTAAVFSLTDTDRIG